MELFLYPLFGLSVLLTLIKLSLMERIRHAVIVSVATAALLPCLLPWAVRWNLNALHTALQNYTTLANLCVLLVFEAIALLLLVARLMRCHFHGEGQRWIQALALQPSWACLIGLYGLLIALVNHANGHSFTWIATVTALVTLIVLVVGQFLLRWLWSHWQQRLEVILGLSFLQLILGMFLPLLARGLTPPAHSTSGLGPALLWSVLLSLPIVALAFVVRVTLRRLTQQPETRN